MAGLQQTDLSYAWEKYMDCRLQGADLQVGCAGGVGVQAQLRGLSLGAGDARCPGTGPGQVLNMVVSINLQTKKFPFTVLQPHSLIELNTQGFRKRKLLFAHYDIMR